VTICLCFRFRYNSEEGNPQTSSSLLLTGQIVRTDKKTEKGPLSPFLRLQMERYGRRSDLGAGERGACARP
jgi:hypothetical protein